MKKLTCVLVAAATLGIGLALPGPADAHRRGPARFHHRRVFVTHAFVFAPFAWDPFWYPPPPAPVIIERQPRVYIQQPQPSYWYYCADAAAYYPYVQQCPKGWMKVIPPEAGPGQPR